LGFGTCRAISRWAAVRNELESLSRPIRLPPFESGSQRTALAFTTWVKSNFVQNRGLMQCHRDRTSAAEGDMGP
jgi:hypothetical protein